MCGISGYISSLKSVSNNALNDTLELMKRRGPDSLNFYKNFEFKKEILLIHSRLNIIDLHQRSNQPFFYKDLILIFNGEIYNYIELRNSLKKRNYKFETNSDTEVLIKSYIEYGEKCVDHFIGMWAFAIWDVKKKKIIYFKRSLWRKTFVFFYG